MTRKKQQEVYKRLVNVVIELGRRENDEAVYAISDTLDVIGLIGGQEMLDAMEIKGPVRVTSIRQELSDGFARLIEAIDGM